MKRKEYTINLSDLLEISSLVAIFAAVMKVFFEVMQNKERERNALVSIS